jgi:HEAT repeat protein
MLFCLVCWRLIQNFYEQKLERAEWTIPILVTQLKAPSKFRFWPLYGKLWRKLPGKMQGLLDSPLSAGDEGPILIRRIDSARGLGDLGEHGEKAVPALIRIVRNRNENPNLRLFCIQSLGNIGPIAYDATPTLIRILAQDYEANERPAVTQADTSMRFWILERAVTAIAKIGSSDQQTLDLIKRVAPITNRFVNISAAMALWRLEPTGDRLITVSNYLSKGSPVARSQSVYILGQMGETSVKRFHASLTEMLDDPEEPVRKAAATTLRKLARSANETKK